MSLTIKRVDSASLRATGQPIVAPFKVTNQYARTVTVEGRIYQVDARTVEGTPGAPPVFEPVADANWLKVETDNGTAQQSLAPNQEGNFTVRIVPPADRFGVFRFGFRALDADAPEATSVDHAMVEVELARGAKQPFNWKLWGAVAAAVLLLVCGGVAWMLMSKPGPKPRSAIVPDVIGQAPEAAAERLSGLGFAVDKKPVWINDAKREKPAAEVGKVYKQEPLAGQDSKEDGVVMLFVPTADLPPDRVLVPSVLNQSLTVAALKLQAAGLKIDTDKITPQGNATAAPDTVLASDPPAGTPVDPNTQKIGLVYAVRPSGPVVDHRTKIADMVKANPDMILALPTEQQIKLRSQRFQRVAPPNP